jgi:hypothetical protein
MVESTIAMPYAEEQKGSEFRVVFSSCFSSFCAEQVRKFKLLADDYIPSLKLKVIILSFVINVYITNQ